MQRTTLRVAAGGVMALLLLGLSAVYLAAQAPEDLLPLAVGNRWEYRGSMTVTLNPPQNVQGGVAPGMGAAAQQGMVLSNMPAALVREVARQAREYDAPRPVYEIKQEWQVFDAPQRTTVIVPRDLFASAGPDNYSIHAVRIPAVGTEVKEGRIVLYDPPLTLLQTPLEARKRWRVGKWRQDGLEGLEMTVYARCEGEEDVKVPLTTYRDAVKIFYYANDIHGSLSIPRPRPEVEEEEEEEEQGQQPSGQQRPGQQQPGQMYPQPGQQQPAQAGMDVFRIIGGEMFLVEWYAPGVGMVQRKSRLQLTTNVGTMVNAQLVWQEQFGLATQPRLLPAQPPAAPVQ